MIILGCVTVAGIFAAGLTRESAVMAEVVLGTNDFWKSEEIVILRQFHSYFLLSFLPIGPKKTCSTSSFHVRLIRLGRRKLGN